MVRIEERIKEIESLIDVLNNEKTKLKLEKQIKELRSELFKYKHPTITEAIDCFKSILIHVGELFKREYDADIQDLQGGSQQWKKHKQHTKSRNNHNRQTIEVIVV